MAFCRERVKQRLALYHGVFPIYMEFSDDAEETFSRALSALVVITQNLILYAFGYSFWYPLVFHWIIWVIMPYLWLFLEARFIYFCNFAYCISTSVLTMNLTYFKSVFSKMFLWHLVFWLMRMPDACHIFLVWLCFFCVVRNGKPFVIYCIFICLFLVFSVYLEICKK